MAYPEEQLEHRVRRGGMGADRLRKLRRGGHTDDANVAWRRGVGLDVREDPDAEAAAERRRRVIGHRRLDGQNRSRTVHHGRTRRRGVEPCTPTRRGQRNR